MHNFDFDIAKRSLCPMFYEDGPCAGIRDMNDAFAIDNQKRANTIIRKEVDYPLMDICILCPKRREKGV